MMNSLWPSRPSNEEELKADADANATGSPIRPDEDTEEAPAVADIGPEHAEQPNPPQPVRPLLARNSSAPPTQPPPPTALPPPPNQRPPPPVGNAPLPPSDSLSLAQLRRIVAEFPKAEAVAYDFTYEDMGPIDEEIDEWFVYQFWQWVRLSNAQRAFEGQWDDDFGADASWDDVSDEARIKFVSDALAGLSSKETKERLACLGRLVYILLGRWKETAGGAGIAAGRDAKSRSASTPRQLAAMKDGARLVGDAKGAVMIWDALRIAFNPFWYVSYQFARWTKLMTMQGRRRPSDTREQPPRVTGRVDELDDCYVYDDPTLHCLCGGAVYTAHTLG